MSIWQYIGAAGLLVALPSAGYYVASDISKERLSHLEKENQDLRELTKGKSVIDALNDFRAVSEDMKGELDRKKRITELEDNLKKSSEKIASLEDTINGLQEQISLLQKSAAEKADEINQLQKAVQKDFSSIKKFSIKEGNSLTIYEPDLVVGIPRTNIYTKEVWISSGNVTEKKLAVGERLEMEFRGKNCSLSFLGFSVAVFSSSVSDFTFYCPS